MRRLNKNILEDGCLRTHRRENLKSYKNILIEEMNKLYSSVIVLMFIVRCDITIALMRLAVRNDLLHWLCTSEFLLKQYVLLSVCIHDCSV
jgi:hypothetical protein